MTATRTALYMLEGASEFRWGAQLENVDRVEAGDLVYIPEGVPHQPYNPTDYPCFVVITRTDPNEQESVVVLPDDFPNALKVCPVDSGDLQAEAILKRNGLNINNWTKASVMATERWAELNAYPK